MAFMKRSEIVPGLVCATARYASVEVVSINSRGMVKCLVPERGVLSFPWQTLRP